MSQEATNGRKAKTGGEALKLACLGAVIVVAIALAAWALMQPGVMESLLHVAVILAVAIVIVAIAAYAVYAIMAIPMYVMKGEQYQEGVDYNLDDVEPVDGKVDGDHQD